MKLSHLVSGALAELLHTHYSTFKISISSTAPGVPGINGKVPLASVGFNSCPWAPALRLVDLSKREVRERFAHNEVDYLAMIFEMPLLIIFSLFVFGGEELLVFCLMFWFSSPSVFGKALKHVFKCFVEQEWTYMFHHLAELKTTCFDVDMETMKLKHHNVIKYRGCSLIQQLLPNWGNHLKLHSRTAPVRISTGTHERWVSKARRG